MYCSKQDRAREGRISTIHFSWAGSWVDPDSMARCWYHITAPEKQLKIVIAP